MAETKIAVVALLLVAMLAVSSVPAVSAYGCFEDCYKRCSNGKESVACATMCSQACIVPKGVPTGLGGSVGN